MSYHLRERWSRRMEIKPQMDAHSQKYLFALEVVREN